MVGLGRSQKSPAPASSLCRWGGSVESERGDSGVLCVPLLFFCIRGWTRAAVGFVLQRLVWGCVCGWRPGCGFNAGGRGCCWGRWWLASRGWETSITNWGRAHGRFPEDVNTEESSRPPTSRPRAVELLTCLPIVRSVPHCDGTPGLHVQELSTPSR